MATAKPGAGKSPAESEKAEAPPVKKSRKTMVFIILALVLAGGGAAAYLYFLKNPADVASSEEKAPPVIAPKYVALGTFTDNLVHEDSDRYLQVSISIKISKPELEEAIKARNPEILDHVNMLLSSQRPSVLATIAGKQKLARDIKTQIEVILGLRNAAPSAVETQSASAPAATETQQSESGIEEVLFTSFIIQ